MLAEHFVQSHALRAGKQMDGISPAAVAMLVDAPWPGNVRELENAVERAVVLSRHRTLQVDDVVVSAPDRRPSDKLPSLNLKGNLDWTERETLRQALTAKQGVKKDAAEAMGISQRALSYYLSKHRLDDGRS